MDLPEAQGTPPPPPPPREEFQIRNPWNIFACGIWNLGNFDRRIRGPGLWNPESTAWNPESRTVLDSLTWGDKPMLSPQMPRDWNLLMIYWWQIKNSWKISPYKAQLRLTFRILCTSGTSIFDSQSKTPQSGLDLAQLLQRFGVRGFWKWVKWRQHANSLLSYSIKTIACDRYSTKLYIYSSTKLQS